MAHDQDMESQWLNEVVILRARVAELERVEQERREAESQLRESRARLRMVVANCPLVLFAMNEAGVLTLSEGKGLEALGLKPGEAVGRSVFEMYSQSPAVMGQCRRALLGEAFTSQVELAGQVFETRFSPMRSPDGRLTGSIGVATVVTDRVAAEKARRESDEKFRLLADNIPGVIYLCANDADYTMHYLNDAVESLTGYPKEDFLSHRIAFAQLFHPEDRDAIYRDVDAALARRQPFHLIYRIHRRDGKMIWIEEYGVGVFRDGQLEYLEGYLTDITQRMLDRQALEQAKQALAATVSDRTRELRESEERFRQIAENIDQVFWLTSGDLSKVIYVSPAYERIWGRPVCDLYEDPQHWIKSIHPQDRQRTARAYYDHVLEGAFNVEYRIIRPDGAVRQIRDRGFPVRDAAGNVIRVAGVADDVTDLRTTEEQARQTQERLAQALRVASVGEMASGLAHELNQPWTAAAAYLKGCERRLDAGTIAMPELRAILAKVAAQVDRAGGILRSVKRYMARCDGHLACCDVNALVQSAADLAELTLRHGEVSLRLDLATQPAMVEADPVQLEQVLLNLMRNGVEAMADAGSPRRQLTVRTELDDAAGVRVSVSDTGPGVAAEVAANLFEPLFTTKRTGLGMGLTISRSIIESCRGRIGLAPLTPGGGATFWFSLPSAKGSTHECDRRSSADGAADGH